MPEIFLIISVIVGLVLLYLYKTIAKVPIIIYLLLAVYNTLPYAAHRYLDANIYFADYLFVDYAFQVYVYGLVGFLSGCISIRLMTNTIRFSPAPIIQFSNLKLVSIIVFILLILVLAAFLSLMWTLRD